MSPCPFRPRTWSPGPKRKRLPKAKRCGTTMGGNYGKIHPVQGRLKPQTGTIEIQDVHVKPGDGILPPVRQDGVAETGRASGGVVGRR